MFFNVKIHSHACAQMHKNTNRKVYHVQVLYRHSLLCTMVVYMMSYSTVCTLHGINGVAIAVASVLSGISEML